VRDPASLAAALIEALERPDARTAWAARAKATVRAFTADRMVERTLEEYQRARATGSGTEAV
jgi:glycosyltransferase involved in cell wall biosynthesis